MRVLWIEDFGEQNSYALLPQVFEDFLAPDVRDALAQTQARGGKRPSDYNGWRDWYAGQPETVVEIDIYRSATDFEVTLKAPDLVGRYDAALLDVDLNNGYFGDGADVDATLGGLWAFGRLVSKRFPAHRVALLTAHTSETEIENFKRTCRQRGLEEINVIDKGATGGAKTWLVELLSENEGFLSLRRGVIEGIAWAQDHLTTESIRLNKYRKDWTVDTFSIEEITSHLKGICNSMPVSVSPRDLQDQLHLFVRQLGFFWDRTKEQSFPDDYYRSLGIMLRHLRNWSSHGQLLTPGVRLAALLSIAHLRTTVAGDEDTKRTRPYERKLLDAIGTDTTIDIKAAAQRLADSDVSVQKALSPLVGKPSRFRDKKGQPRAVKGDQRFADALNEIEGAKDCPDNFPFERYLLEVFIHDSPGIATKVTSLHNCSQAKDTYSQCLRNNSTPIWVKEIWRRILSA